MESAWAQYLDLGIADQLFVAGIRCFVQLSLLGYILAPIFKANNAVLVMAYIFGFMILVSAYEAAARPKMSYPGVFKNAVYSIGVALFIGGCLLMCIVAPTPWYNAQYLIPLAGMLINNALTGLAPAMNMIIDGLSNNRQHINLLLAYGATPREATKPIFTTTFRQGLIPAINGMNVIGLVSIPGMMTGQILGGSSPAKAANYQIVITCLISGSQMIAVYLVLTTTIKSLFDARGRIAPQRLTKQSSLNIAQLFSPKAWRERRAKAAKGVASAKGAEGSPTASDALVAAGGESPDVALTPLKLKPDATSPAGDRVASSSKGEAIFDINLHGLVAGKRSVSLQLTLHEDEVACIMGPSGIGKSTLLRMVSDFQESDGSTIMRLQGQLLQAVQGQEWRKNVLYVHQGGPNLPDTPSDFLLSIQRLKVNKGAPTFDPNPYLQAFGIPFDFMSKPWAELSGGEAQRVMLALALSTRPPCILLDEPTSALDETSKRAVEDCIKNLDWKCCIVWVTHDEQQAARVATSRWRLVDDFGSLTS
eukprot:TRINITY_DN35792_c0_g1_i1.p1 TRINITY_DN35792_c0_g1~~TRINITY_DN35792_c0_g1_i1.p1  ORF type:complete len:615 (+),score=81.13 TRINITY_DN35792_c0_g1_i1:242-1846(+)